MLILFNKPYGVICQFSKHEKHKCLADYISIKDVYPAGRLDTDSEGLLLLTDDGRLQHQLSHPIHQKEKVYWAQVEGAPNVHACEQLQKGVRLNDGLTKPAQVEIVSEPDWLWPREPAIRVRAQIPTHWLKLTLTEGRNRQVRRMTASVGLPTLRLIRSQVAGFTLFEDAQILAVGEVAAVENRAHQLNR